MNILYFYLFLHTQKIAKENELINAIGHKQLMQYVKIIELLQLLI